MQIERTNDDLAALRKSLRREHDALRRDLQLDAIFLPLMQQQVFKDPTPLAALATGWTVSPEFAWWLFQHVRTEQPKLVIELGSGLSTIVIASALDKNGGGRLLAFEHEQVYLEKTAAHLRSQGLAERVDLVYTPLRTYRFGDEEYRWYDIPWPILRIATAEHGAELVLVDGPPQATGAMARYPAHPLLKKYYAPSARILLDDAGREDEQQIAARWREEDLGLWRVESFPEFRHQPLLLHWTGADGVEKPEAEAEEDDLAAAVERAIARTVASRGDADFNLATLIPEIAPALHVQLEGWLSLIRRELADARNEAVEMQNRVKEAEGAVEASRAEVTELRAALSRANQRIKEQDRRIDRFKNTLSMQLGPVIGRNLGSPTGWVRLPFELLATYRKIKSQKKAFPSPTNSAESKKLPQRASGTPAASQSLQPHVKLPQNSGKLVENSQELLSKRPPTPLRISKATTEQSTSAGQKKTSPEAKAQTHTMWQAQRIVEEADIDAAIQYAETFIQELERPCIEILRANKGIENDTRWLEHVNRYLAHFNTSAITLATEGASRFQRLAPGNSIPLEAGPRISVIMPAFNAERTIRHAVQSILKQTWQSLELIIVDDASTDRTGEIAQNIAASDKRVSVLHNATNVGPYVSKNRALMLATGAYITGHDADDWAHPDRLEKQVNAIITDKKNRPACITYMIRMNESGEFTHFTKIGSISPDGVARKAMISCLFEADFFRNRLGFWDSVRFGADSEMIARAEIAAGLSILRLRHIGMLCLDLETSLTNHPEHGVCKVNGISETRRIYRAAWEQWHKSCDCSSIFLPFPHCPRLFHAPDAALVPMED